MVYIRHVKLCFHKPNWYVINVLNLMRNDWRCTYSMHKSVTFCLLELIFHVGKLVNPLNPYNRYSSIV